MYFSGILSIDPSKLTNIRNIQPTKAFGKLLYSLTGGSFAKKEEQETFTAVSVLQQLNMSLRAMNITNIVRLAKDDFDYYFDEEGKKDDMKEAMDHFKMNTDCLDAELFNTLYLVVEHEEGALKYLVEIEIKRSHEIGEYPINVIVNGVVTEFTKRGTESTEELKARLKPLFESQEAYDGFQRKQQAAFSQFMDQLKMEIKRTMRIDDVIDASQTQVIRPKELVNQMNQIKHDRARAPIYHGYYGYDDSFFYAYLWAEMSHDHHIHYHNVAIVDEHGEQLFEVGNEGFNAGENETMNPDASFEAPMSDDITYPSDSDYSVAREGGDSSFWGDLGLGDSGSSSSCAGSDGGSSCGGGCGGGD